MNRYQLTCYDKIPGRNRRGYFAASATKVTETDWKVHIVADWANTIEGVLTMEPLRLMAEHHQKWLDKVAISA